MTQVIDVIRDALGHLGVIDAHSAPSATDTRDAMKALNRMMNAWEADGLSVGWLDVTEPAQEMPTPIEADEAIGANLAVRLAPKYGQTVDPVLASLAMQGEASMRAAVTSATFARTSFEDLPLGESQPVLYGWQVGLRG